jgi:hypothetical protein
MKVSSIIHGADPKPVTKAKNLAFVGWHEGYMLVRFRTNGDRWIYGPNIPQERLYQLLKNPFPDSLFQKVIKSKFKAYKVPA